MTLPEYIISKLNIPFEYGINDCVIFCITWIEAESGIKYLPAKLWKNEKEALQLIKKNGGLEAVFDKKFTQINPNFAKDGDLALVDGIAFLFSGNKIVSVSKDGLTYKSRMLAKKAWSWQR